MPLKPRLISFIFFTAIIFLAAGCASNTGQKDPTPTLITTSSITDSITQTSTEVTTAITTNTISSTTSVDPPTSSFTDTFSATSTIAPSTTQAAVQSDNLAINVSVSAVPYRCEMGCRCQVDIFYSARILGERTVTVSNVVLMANRTIWYDTGIRTTEKDFVGTQYQEIECDYYLDIDVIVTTSDNAKHTCNVEFTTPTLPHN